MTADFYQECFSAFSCRTAPHYDIPTSKLHCLNDVFGVVCSAISSPFMVFAMTSIEFNFLLTDQTIFSQYLIGLSKSQMSFNMLFAALKLSMSDLWLLDNYSDYSFDLLVYGAMMFLGNGTMVLTGAFWSVEIYL